MAAGVMKTGPANRWRGVLIAALVLGTCLSALAAVYSAYQGRQLLNALYGLRKEQRAMDVEWQRLQLERSTSEAYQNIETEARTTLRMAPPRPEQIVIVRP